MSKRKNKKLSLIIGIVALVLILALLIPMIINYDTLFGKTPGEEPGDEQGGNVDEVPGEGGSQEEDPGEEDNVKPIFKVYLNDVELVPGEAVESTESVTTLTIVTESDYEASFVKTSDYRRWNYYLEGEKWRFNPDLNVLKTRIEGNVASIEFPFDVMDWVLLQHDGATQEQVDLPTDVNFNVPYVALQVKIGEEIFLYPIQFDLNGVWTKCYLDKDEIVFCD